MLMVKIGVNRFFRMMASRYLAVALFLLPGALRAQLPRGYKASDSIEMAAFSRDSQTGKEEIKFSPGGQYFFTVTTRGLLQSNELESSIWIFDSVAVKSFLQNPSVIQRPNPKPLLRIATSSNS